MVCGGFEEKVVPRVVVMDCSSCRRAAGRLSKAFCEGEVGDCEAGSDSGRWDVVVAEELGKRGTGGRFRTGVEGACVVVLGWAGSVGSTRF